ncbi:MAG: response regulator, partial [Sphingomonadaceae bacterium]|nr:response regulator [Sphingomonadaceae bacterium]
DSAPGEGTTLSLYLPRAAESARDAPLPLTASDDAPRGLRVLLVEDSRTVAAFAEAVLEEIGCEAIHARDAEEALALLDEQRFDIVFSDIVMPGLSGLELATRLRAERPRLPILLATAYSEAAARGEGSEFPILTKPYRRDALARMIGETIETSRLAA